MLEQVAKVGRDTRAGDPLDAATVMGAIVDAQQMQRVLGYIEAGRAEGAQLALGGQRRRARTAAAATSSPRSSTT